MANQTVYPYGTGGSLPSSIGLVNDLETGGADEALAAEQGKFLGEYLFGKEQSINLGSITESDYYLGDSAWTVNGKHKVIPVTPGEKYTIKVLSSQANGAYYGYLTSSYAAPSSASAIPYVSGTTRIWVNNGASANIVVPSNCAYICVCTMDYNQKSATWGATKYYLDYNEDIRGDIAELRELSVTHAYDPIDISSLSMQTCSLGTSTWYSSASNPKHIAVPISEHSTIHLQVTGGSASGGFYCFVTSSYSAPVTPNASIPFVQGGSRLFLQKNASAVDINVPSDAAYLILNVVDGGGASSSWSVSDMVELTLDEAFQNYCVKYSDIASGGTGAPIRIKVASWNIGGFSLGTSGSPTITPATFDEMRSKWRAAVNTLGVDVLCCCEYNTTFMDAQSGSEAVSARDAIFTDDVFAYAKVGPEVTGNTYMQTAVFANVNLETSTVVPFQTTVQQGRYYQVTETHMSGKLVKIVSTHLDFGNSSSDDDAGNIARRSQINALITAFANDDYVIICGDFNVVHGTSGDYNIFKEAGYGMVNCGYLGDIKTYPAGSTPTVMLDNIIYKGFVSSKIDVLNDATLSDHAAIFADLTMVQ